MNQHYIMAVAVLVGFAGIMLTANFFFGSKLCPNCRKMVNRRSKECKFCGRVFDPRERVRTL